MPVAGENAGAAATGQPRPRRLAIGQPARGVGGIEAVHQIQRRADDGAAVGVETSTCPRCVTTSSWPGARILGVVGIPITGWRHRIHWVGGNDSMAPGWPT